MGPATASDSSELPQFGTERRVVMSEMRRAGLSEEKNTGTELVYGGGPGEWSDASQATYTFEAYDLRQIELRYDGVVSDGYVCELYQRLWQRLKNMYGYPWQQAQALGDACKGGKPAARLSAQWNDFTVRASLEVDRTQANVRVTLAPDAEGAAQQASKAADEPFERYATAARMAAEVLLEEFSDQPFVVDVARERGQPLNVRLDDVQIPTTLTSVDKGLIERRLRTLVRGDWNLELTRSRSAADLDLRVAIVPALRDRQRVYAMTLEARQARGKNRGRVLWSGARILETDFSGM